MSVVTCRGCGAPIIFALVGHTNNKSRSRPVKRMPFDACPNPIGQWAVRQPKDGSEALAIYVGAKYSGDRYVSHFATCPDAERFRKKGVNDGGKS
jgi:hypothetical protein